MSRRRRRDTGSWRRELAARINERFWARGGSSYADFYGTRAQAMSAAEGAIKQIGLKEADETS